MTLDLLDYVASRQVGETPPFIGQVVEVCRSASYKDGVTVRYRVTDGRTKHARVAFDLAPAMGPCRSITHYEVALIFAQNARVA